MTELTPLIIYNDLYASSFKDLIKYGLTEDQASRKANIYAVKHTWFFFSSTEPSARTYRAMLNFSLNPPKAMPPLTKQEFDELLKGGIDAAVSRFNQQHFI